MSRVSPAGSERVLRSRVVRKDVYTPEDDGDFTEDDSDEEQNYTAPNRGHTAINKGSPLPVSDKRQNLSVPFRRFSAEIKNGTPLSVLILSRYNKVFVVVLCVLVVLFCGSFLWASTGTKKSNFDEFDLFKMLIFKERRSFKQNDGTFEMIAEGVAPPTCVTLVYLDGKEEAECISSRIKNIYETTFSKNAIVLRGSEIYEAERFDFLESYGRKLNQSKLMVLYDLQNINYLIAENFHSLCDVENPFLADSLIIFTLNLDPKHKSLKNPLKKAHRTLSDKWKQLEISALDPLITRVTTVVVEINKENEFKCPN